MRIGDKRPRSTSWWPYLAVTAPILLYFAPLLVLSQVPIDFASDTAFYFYPLTATGMAAWGAGRLPLWTSNIQSGFPLLADGQGALLYPPNLLLYWLLPGPLASNLVIVLQTILSAIGMYHLARSLKLPAMPAVLSSWIWVVAAVFGSQSSPQLNAVTWWPILVWLALRLSDESRRWRDAALAAVITGLMWLGGFPQMALYGIILASAFLLYAVLFDKPFERSNWRSMVSNRLQPVVLWALSLGLGTGLAAIQLLPTLEMSGFSVRAGGVESGLAEQGSLFPVGLLGYINPGWNVEGFLSAPVYIGSIALALALLRLRRSASPLEKFLWVVCGVSLLLAFGKYTPLYYLISKLPGLSFLRVPVRFTMLTTFSLSLLAAHGLNQLSATLPLSSALRSNILAPEGIKPLRNRLRFVIGVAVAISLLGGIVARLGREVLLDIARQFVERTLLGGRYRVQGWDYYEAKISTIYTQITDALSPTSPRTLQPIIIAALALLAIRYWRTSSRERHSSLSRTQAILLVLAGIDLMWLLGNPLARLSPANLLSPPRVVDQIAAASESSSTPNRLYEMVTQSDIIVGSNPYSTLTANYNLMFGVPHTGVYSALGSLRYFELLGTLGGVNLAYGPPPSSPEALRENLNVLNLIGARHIVANQPVDNVNFVPLSSSPPYLYINPNALPRAFFVSRAIIVPPDEVVSTVRSQGFSPSETVVLETNVDVRFAANEGRQDVVFVRDEGTTIELRTTGVGWLVLTDLYYPGWRARVDGKETPIYRADAVFRAISIPDTGEHVVTYSYEPDSFRYGLSISAISMILVISLVAWGVISSRTRGRTELLRNDRGQ